MEADSRKESEAEGQDVFESQWNLERQPCSKPYKPNFFLVTVEFVLLFLFISSWHAVTTWCALGKAQPSGVHIHIRPAHLTAHNSTGTAVRQFPSNSGAFEE